MQAHDQLELKRRLALLEPLFRDLGARTIETYARAGILAAIHDSSFPVSDAVFTHKTKGYSYHPHGPVYFSITREGTLELAGQGAGGSITEAIYRYAEFARQQDLDDMGSEAGATERFPPPRFLVGTGTSQLYVAAVAQTKRQSPHALFITLEQYLEERAGLFVEAFRAAR